MKRVDQHFLVLVFFMIAGLSLTAQDCDVYFPLEEGSVREMTSYDKKDKVTGKTVQTVKEVVREDDRLGIVVEAEIYDDKEEFILSKELEMVCENGVFKFDMSNYFDQSAMANMEGFDIKMDVKELEIPANLAVGDKLPDGMVSVEASTGDVTMFRMNVNITDRNIEAEEEVTTPAGTFDCYKITYKVETKVMVRTESYGADWIAPGVGVVRSETYNKNGKLTDYSLLTDYK